MPTAADPLYLEDNRTETFSIVPTTELSTNYTESGLIGPGRTLGIFYDYAGRRLERVVGRVAHKAGFGPQATYLKMQELLSTEWKVDDNKSNTLLLLPPPIQLISHSPFLESLFCKLCFTLLDYMKYAFRKFTSMMINGLQI